MTSLNIDLDALLDAEEELENLTPMGELALTLRTIELLVEQESTTLDGVRHFVSTMREDLSDDAWCAIEDAPADFLLEVNDAVKALTSYGVSFDDALGAIDDLVTLAKEAQEAGIDYTAFPGPPATEEEIAELDAFFRSLFGDEDDEACTDEDCICHAFDTEGDAFDVEESNTVSAIPAEDLTEPGRILYQAICEAIGAASVCWENPGGAGVFQSDRALKIANDLLNRIDDIVEEFPPNAV